MLWLVYTHLTPNQVQKSLCAGAGWWGWWGWVGLGWGGECFVYHQNTFSSLLLRTCYCARQVTHVSVPQPSEFFQFLPPVDE